MASGIMTITALRSANALPANGPGIVAEKYRSLSPDGLEMIKHLRTFLGNCKYDLVISSPATRAIETARIMSGQREGIIQLENLYPWGLGTEAMTAGQANHTKSFHYYLCHRIGGEIFRNQTQIALSQIKELIGNDDGDARSILIVGSGALLMAVAWEAYPLEFMEFIKNLSRYSLGEAEGFRLAIDPRSNLANFEPIPD